MSTTVSPCHLRVTVGVKAPAIMPCAHLLFAVGTLDYAGIADCRFPGWDVEIMHFVLTVAGCSYELVPVGSSAS